MSRKIVNSGWIQLAASFSCGVWNILLSRDLYQVIFVQFVLMGSVALRRILSCFEL